MSTQDNTNECNRLVKAKYASQYLSISERKLWELSHKGAIPVVRIDRAIRYDIIDLDNFIQKMKTGRDE